MAETTQELSDRNRWLRKQGYNWELIVRNEQRATWYKADGTSLPNLPADNYHIKRFRAKGWTLIPPETVTVPTEPAPTPEPTPEPVPVPAHQCSFARALGSPCKTEGCISTRQVTYRKRRKVAA